jgi:hypothetical protein
MCEKIENRLSFKLYSEQYSDYKNQIKITLRLTFQESQSSGCEHTKHLMYQICWLSICLEDAIKRKIF